jgi:hypothetical protein
MEYLKIEKNMETKLSDIDPSEGITDMRDLFPDIGKIAENAGIKIEVLTRRDNETAKEFIKRCKKA